MRLSILVVTGVCALVSVLCLAHAAEEEKVLAPPLLRRRGLSHANFLTWPYGREKDVEVIEDITYGAHEDYRWDKDMNTMKGPKGSKGDDDDDSKKYGKTKGGTKGGKGYYGGGDGKGYYGGGGGEGKGSNSGDTSMSSSSTNGEGKGSYSASASSSTKGEGKGTSSSSSDGKGYGGGADGKGYGKGYYRPPKYTKGDDDGDDDMSMNMSYKYKYKYHRKERTLVENDESSEECFMAAICENSPDTLSVCCEDDNSGNIGCSTCGGCKADAGLPVSCCASNGSFFMPPFACNDGELCCNVGGSFECTEAVGGMCPSTPEVSAKMN